MKVLFFGDSFTSGENNNFNSYVEKLGLENYRNFGVSGTTIGDYSIYPVGPNDFLNQLQKNIVEVRGADIICLEYGINDATAYYMDMINDNQLFMSIIKCIDFIRQVNKKAKIVYLQVAENFKIIEELGKAQLTYLRNDYLKDVVNFFQMSESRGTWVYIYQWISKVINKKVDKTIVLIDDIDFMKKYIDSDSIHPNDEGYQIIANKVREELNYEGIDYRK